MIADAGVFISSARLQEINDHEIVDAQTKAGNAIERAAILEKEAAAIRERAAILEREVGLRHLNGSVFLSIIGDEPKGEFEIRYAAEDQDSLLLALDLRVLLIKSGWELIDERPIPTAELLRSSPVLLVNVRK
jgi:hypothetical protein